MTTPGGPEQAQRIAHTLTNSERRYSDEAQAAYGLSMSKYASRLQALAEGKAEGEMVLAKHVELAVTELSSDEELPLKTVVDWLKRVAFLFVGFTVVQGINVFRPDQLDRGSVKWFIADLIITTALVAIAFILDFPIVRDYFRRRAGK